MKAWRWNLTWTWQNRFLCSSFAVLRSLAVSWTSFGFPEITPQECCAACAIQRSVPCLGCEEIWSWKEHGFVKVKSTFLSSTVGLCKPLLRKPFSRVRRKAYHTWHTWHNIHNITSHNITCHYITWQDIWHYTTLHYIHYLYYINYIHYMTYITYMTYIHVTYVRTKQNMAKHNITQDIRRSRAAIYSCASPLSGRGWSYVRARLKLWPGKTLNAGWKQNIAFLLQKGLRRLCESCHPPLPPFPHSHSYEKATVRIKHRRTIKKSHDAFIFACSGPLASLFLRHSALLYLVFSLCGPCGFMLLVSECFTFFTAVDCTQALGRLDTCVWFGSCTSCALPWMHIIINMLLLARLMLSVVSACVPWPILEGFVNEQRSLINIDCSMGLAA